MGEHRGYLVGLVGGQVGLGHQLVLHAAPELRVLLKESLHVQHQPGEPHLATHAGAHTHTHTRRRAHTHTQTHTHTHTDTQTQSVRGTRWRS